MEDVVKEIINKKRRVYNKTYKQKHPEQVKKDSQLYYSRHREECIEKAKARQSTPEAKARISEYNKEYSKRNRDKINAQRRERYRRKKEEEQNVLQ